MKIFIKFEYSHFGYSKSILYISTWYTSCYLQVKTNATQAELTHAIIIIIMPWLYCCCSVCIWFRFMVRQPKFGNIISEDSKLSRVAPWCGKGKNWKDVWLTDDLRVFDYVLLTDINIPFGISCKHSQK